MTDIPNKIWAKPFPNNSDFGTYKLKPRCVDKEHTPYYHISDEHIDLLETLATLSDEALFYYVGQTRDMARAIIDREG